jgi:hypothetical protein
LNSIFDSASPKPAPASQTTEPGQGEEGLKAMLGLQSRQQAALAPPLPTSQHPVTPPALEALFASAAISPSKTAAKEKPSIVNGKNDTAAEIVYASLQSKAKSSAALPPSLNRRDFVREVLSLIHVSVLLS